MDQFKYGQAFFAVNEFHFSKYEECQTSDEMKEGEAWVAAEIEKEREERRNAAIDFGPQSSDEEYEDQDDGQEDDDNANKQSNAKFEEEKVGDDDHEPQTQDLNEEEYAAAKSVNPEQQKIHNQDLNEEQNIGSEKIENGIEKINLNGKNENSEEAAEVKAETNAD